jgi:hypothetical protein
MAKPASFRGSKLACGAFSVENAGCAPEACDERRCVADAHRGHRDRKCRARAHRVLDHHIRAGRSLQSARHLSVDLPRRNIQEGRANSIECHGRTPQLHGEWRPTRKSGLTAEIGAIDRNQHLRNDGIAAATSSILDSPYDWGLAECAGNRREDESHLIHREEEVQHKCPFGGRGGWNLNSISTIRSQSIAVWRISTVGKGTRSGNLARLGMKSPSRLRGLVRRSFGGDRSALIHQSYL